MKTFKTDHYIVVDTPEEWVEHARAEVEYAMDDGCIVEHKTIYFMDRQLIFGFNTIWDDDTGVGFPRAVLMHQDGETASLQPMGQLKSDLEDVMIDLGRLFTHSFGEDGLLNALRALRANHIISRKYLKGIPVHPWERLDEDEENEEREETENE